ncbi:S-adenosyl-L-methionine-dependent methyltransferase [Protomyces lactucae-debilis]|uniref:S-adenosyl-L-methionine-dependent methyltransferase n=1 Tax=Protomyces lactucae-debilis TaxID=2754530 RepID=A0A1Y2FN80_PROLT|nr:S-adenosyl-L-methionine-dependent methyltransferase [Protomyces lactucae-debilis]ORY85442.1 S-adenosyl-L-methionine-dependent methyltransferase [Protomyces lactucae-debilis]
MGRKQKGGARQPKSRDDDWKAAAPSNERFVQYYRKQNLCASDDEFEQMLAAFKRVLPTTFRLTGTRENCRLLQDYMERAHFPFLKDKEYDGQCIAPPRALSWYPESLAYQLDVPKIALRKDAQFKQFQRFLVMETESGNMIRQEAVSMIPPLLMDIRGDSVCLDMCAAPGSKTSQMVELLHARAAEQGQDPIGLVVANDSDYKRAYMLVHQLKRLNSPNLLVTNHDATCIPNFLVDKEGTPQKFDRILADVPCSGDGTLRKNVDIWRAWQPTSGLSLHPTQVNCLKRGLQMLAVGGRLVYSTCSLNPIENEAVLHAVLREISDAAHLVDVSHELPELVRRPGLYTWHCTDHAGNTIDSVEAVEESKRHRFPASIFPPLPGVAEALHLERCLRIYPHLQDTGGFFVAVIEKTAEVDFNDMESVRYKKRPADGSPQQALKRTKPEQPLEETAAGEVTVDQVPTEIASIQAERTAEPTLPQEVIIDKPKFMRSLNDEYFTFLPSTHPEIQSIAQYFGFDKSGLPLDCFLSRNISGEPVRTLYYATARVKTLIQHNMGRLRFVHAGVKIFCKQTMAHLATTSPEPVEEICPWRLSSDCMDVAESHVAADKVATCTLAELKVFMEHEYPKADLFPESDTSVIQQLEGKQLGCYLVRCDLSKEPDSRVPNVLLLPLWKSRVTLQMMLARKEKETIYARATGETLPAAIKILSKKNGESEAAAVGDDIVSKDASV